MLPIDALYLLHSQPANIFWETGRMGGGRLVLISQSANVPTSSGRLEGWEHGRLLLICQPANISRELKLNTNQGGNQAPG
jgi:hypothetical protein